ARERVWGFDTRKCFRRDGRVARRPDGAGAAGKSGRKTQNHPARSSVGRSGAKSRNVFGGLEEFGVRPSSLRFDAALTAACRAGAEGGGGNSEFGIEEARLVTSSPA